MGCRRLGLAVLATLCLIIAFKPEPARAGSAAALAMTRAGEAAQFSAAQGAPRVSVHFRRTQSYYCYPRNYWWFYRPYTTAQQGNARCMPYFHYLEQPYYRHGAKPARFVK